MKKILLYVLSLFLLIGSALATASLDVPDSVDINSEAGDTASQRFTIRNDGDTDLTKIVFDHNVGDEYNLVFTNTVETLAVDASKTITVTIDVPSDEEIGTINIGDILIDADDGISESIPLNEHIGELSIEDVDVKVGKREETHNNLVDGTKINKEVKPGDPIKFEIDIENLFPKDSENDIDDININVIIAGIDDDEDLEEEEDNIDLDPEQSYGRTFEFKIPLEVEEGEYDVEIEVEGEDDDNIKRKASWTLTLEVEKESHDLRIQSALLSPTKIICGGSSVLSTTVYNFGKAYEDEIKIVVKNSELGINIEDYPIELDNELIEDESKTTKSYAIPVSKSQEAKTYSIEMWAYINEDVLEDYRKLELVVEGCPEEPKEPICGNNVIETGEECDDGNTVNNDGCSEACKTEEIEEEEKEEEQITGGTVITETQEKGNSWLYALVGVNVLVLIVIIVMVIFMFKGKKPEEVLKE